VVRDDGGVIVHGSGVLSKKAREEWGCKARLRVEEDNVLSVGCGPSWDAEAEDPERAIPLMPEELNHFPFFFYCNTRDDDRSDVHLFD
jgi:hypothetical protein